MVLEQLSSSGLHMLRVANINLNQCEQTLDVIEITPRLARIVGETRQRLQLLAAAGAAGACRRLQATASDCRRL